MEFRKATRRLIMGWNVIVIPLALLLLFKGHGWWALTAILSAHALWLAPTLWPACGWWGSVATRLPRPARNESSKGVWLTIDDGPDREDTPRLLDLLDDHKAKATFFFIGEKALRHPELVTEVVRRGHSVGNHSMSHPQYWFWAYGPRAVRREIGECQKALLKCGAPRPRWFRAPAGLKNPWVLETAEREGLRVACWSARGFDGVDANRARVMQRLKQSVTPGGIVLIHEGRVDDEGGRMAPAVLGDLLGWFAANGYRCVLPDDG